MKYFGKMLVGILVLLLVIPATSSSAEDEQWKLEISLEKNSFLLREPIWLDAVVTNISGDTLRSWGLFPPCQGSGFCIDLTDSNGISVAYSGSSYDLVRLEGFLIFQEEQYYDCFDLIELFAIKYLSTYHFGALPPGRYFVQGVYGEAFSNKISFIVVDLTGKEKEAEQLLIDAFKPGSSDTAKPSFLKVFESYPNSVFAEIPARRILGHSDFLKKFPNSGHTRSRLTDDMIGLTDEEKIEYLENAIIKYKGTRAARHAEQLLRRQRK